ncbi:hypothetical protein KT99_14316 [Shewanella benthica KT99]|uniref:Uncharacterized protein n=1 Tax=Shewanella benthica KT99 TaxID=314608 RepID=A9DLV2_9GAMM|nr:hypothetical protein KT99_14316 [Shewanella benthica KT99]
MSKARWCYDHGALLGFDFSVLIKKFRLPPLLYIVKIKHIEHHAMQGLIMPFLRELLRMPVRVSSYPLLIFLNIEGATAIEILN